MNLTGVEGFLLLLLVGSDLYLLLKIAKLKKGNRLNLSIEALNKTNLDLLQEQHQQQTELSQLKEDLNKAKQEHLQLQQAKESLQSQNLSLSEEVTANKKVNEELRKNNEKIVGYIEKKEQLIQEVQELQKELEQEKTSLSQTKKNLKSIKTEISLFQNVRDLVDLGYIEEPQYLFATADRYKSEIKEIRDQQKDLIKQDLAVEVPDEADLEDSDGLSAKVIKQQAKLMLQAFNLECDQIIGSVKATNFAKTLERIENTAERIERLSATLLCGFSQEYIELKFKECELFYHWQLKEDEEREIAKAQKEALREEEKQRKEYEQAAKKAEKEAEAYEKMMEKVKQQIETADEQERQELALKLEMLQSQLDEAQTQKQRAISMAEQTRKGYVYVISNIGTFGEGVYKIGMTRRLDPLERVQELSGASVPFPFEHHILVFSDDAPALETAMHKALADRKLNVINQRKEFFFADFDEIKEIIEAHKAPTDHVREIISQPKAEQYFESRKVNGITVQCFLDEAVEVA